MDELIARIVAKANLTREQAERAVAIIVDFLHREGSPETIELMLQKMPALRALVAEKAKTGRAGLKGGLGGLGGLMGGGAMAALGKLTAEGLDMGQVTTTVREIIAVAREKVGDETVDGLLAKMPILAKII